MCLFVADCLALHRGEKLGVGLRLLQSLEHDFHLLDRRKGIQHTPHYPDAIEVFFTDQQFFLARAGALQVDCREQSLITQATIEVKVSSRRTAIQRRRFPRLVWKRLHSVRNVIDRVNK